MNKIIYIVLSLSIFSHSYSQADTISINNTFDTSQTIYTFNPTQTIYGLRINGSITYDNYTSVARVILVSSDSTELLVYEAYPWLYNNSNWAFSFSDAGDETYYLDTLDAAYIKVEIVDAKIDISTMLIDTTYNINIPTLRESYIDSLRQNKIDSINNKIQTHELLWFAGNNQVAQMTYINKKKIFSNDSLNNFLFNTFGFEYYMGGVFSFLGASLSAPKQSNLVDNFDWRDRHNANWITPVRDQLTMPACWAYSEVASLESIINLYYNQHLDRDLSEQAFVSCWYGIYSQPCTQQDIFEKTLCSMEEIGALEQFCYPETHTFDMYGIDIITGDDCPSLPFPNINCTICSLLHPAWSLNLWKINHSQGLASTTESNIKESIILYGPIAFSMPWTPLPVAFNHAMLMLGYDVINANDTLYFGPELPIIVAVGDSLIGQVYWIVKNSFGDSWGDSGYCKLILDLDNTYFSDVIVTPITQQPTSATYQVSCTDADGDGYYWWGIGVKPATCPLYSPADKDCDDSDPLVGPYDNEYNCTPICVSDDVTEEIDSYYTVDINEYMTNEIIEVKSGGTLIIENNATLFIHPLTEIIVENNGTLILENYGKIRTCSNDPWLGSITVEQGGILDVECVDNDGDGYYWWGTIGPNPSSCSSLAPDELDCDDTDPLVGPDCNPICIFEDVWTEIDNDKIIDLNEYITSNITVKSGYTLTIENHATLFIHPLSQIIVEDGAELFLNNGSIKICSDAAWQGTITAGTGALVRIENESVFVDKNTPQWMPANLNVGTYISTAAGNQTDNSILEKYCYGNVEANCETYGGLYQWDEAMQYYTGSVVSCDPCGPTTGKGGVQGICPSGYHIPSDLEWSRYEWRIENYITPTGTTPLSTFQQDIGNRGSNTAEVGPGDKMKAISGWTGGNGTNTSGFTAIPSGWFGNVFQYLGSESYLWSATEYSSSTVLYRMLLSSSPRNLRYYAGKNAGFSIRCLKD